MRFAALSLLTLVTLALASQEGPEHAVVKRARRNMVKRQGGVVTVLPTTVVVGAITVSNTQAAAPMQTAAAEGAARPPTTPLPGCLSSGGSGAACDPTQTACCGDQLVCRGLVCQQICTLDSTEAYCDDTTPCNAAKGYVCTANRCRPPATASRVSTGSPCDQGGANTLFCLPSKAVCIGGRCTACTQ